MHKVLVTGGAGFIGWRLCQQLAGSRNEIALIDNLSVGLPMPVGDYRKMQGDIRDESAVNKLIAEFKPDVIVHLAAVHHIPTCERERAYALDVNITGTERILQAAEKHEVGHVMIASSGAVYSWADSALDEAVTPLDARDNYALSKLTNERQLAFWQDRTGRKATSCRIFNTIGHDDPNAHLIPDILNQLHKADRKAVIELGNLAPRRDYIHADDTAACLAAIVTGETGNGLETFNIGSGVETSVEDLVLMIGKAMGVEIAIQQDPDRVRRVDRPSQLANMARTKDAFGWSAQKNLADAMKDIVERFNFA